MSELSHIDKKNQPTMVDVSGKTPSDREAHARAIGLTARRAKQLDCFRVATKLDADLRQNPLSCPLDPNQGFLPGDLIGRNVACDVSWRGQRGPHARRPPALPCRPAILRVHLAALAVRSRLPLEP